jgi:hypothetical protein
MIHAPTLLARSQGCPVFLVRPSDDSGVNIFKGGKICERGVGLRVGDRRCRASRGRWTHDWQPRRGVVRRDEEGERCGA